MTQYASERDLQRYTPEVITRVNPLRRITGWVNHAGSVYKAYQTGAVEVCFVNGVDWGAAEATLAAVDAATEWFHDVAADILYIYLTTDPNESRVEAGEDSATSFTWVLTRASRLLDSMLDAHLKIPTLRDRSGNYDDVIIQATCYMAAWIALISEDRELADYYHSQVSNAEHTGIADYLNSGKVKLSRSVDIYSACGEIIAETVVGDLFRIGCQINAFGIRVKGHNQFVGILYLVPQLLSCFAGCYVIILSAIYSNHNLVASIVLNVPSSTGTEDALTLISHWSLSVTAFPESPPN